MYILVRTMTACWKIELLKIQTTAIPVNNSTIIRCDLLDLLYLSVDTLRIVRATIVQLEITYNVIIVPNTYYLPTGNVIE